MPSGIIKSFAQRSGKSVGEVERLWDVAKNAAKKKLGTDSGDRFYALTTGILKNILKLETDAAAPAPPSNTTSSANIAPGQSGNFATKLFKPIQSRKIPKKSKNESFTLIESYGKNYKR